MKAKELDIKLPARLEDLRMKHLAAFTDDHFLTLGSDPDVDTVIAFMHKFTGISKAKLWRVDYHGRFGLYAMYAHITKLFNTLELNDPAKEITIDGVQYEMVNFKSPSGALLRDITNSDFEKDPIRMACISYIPKGTHYGDYDVHKNLLYPISSRYEQFQEHYPLVEYFKLNTFFLRKYATSMGVYIHEQRMINFLQKLKRKKQQD